MKMINDIKKFYKTHKSLVGLMCIVSIVWVLSILILKSYTNLSSGALIGDSFGGVNSLFSGLALAGIIYTIFLQKEEMTSTREVLSLQQEELKLQKEEFKLQNKTLNLQRFENTFFNLISVHHQIVGSISASLPNGTELDFMEFVQKYYDFKGRDFFKKLFEMLTQEQMDVIGLEKFESIYIDFYNQNQTNLGHYFRNLYTIFKFVDNTEFFPLFEFNENLEDYIDKNFKERYKYTSMIRAQLSHYELGLLFYNCASMHGKENFLPLINKYRVLKNIPDNTFPAGYKKLIYQPSAFGLEEWK